MNNKYAERARELTRQVLGAVSYVFNDAQVEVASQPIARALEQTALEARIEEVDPTQCVCLHERMDHEPECNVPMCPCGMFSSRLEQLRARLSGLMEGK